MYKFVNFSHKETYFLWDAASVVCTTLWWSFYIQRLKTWVQRILTESRHNILETGLCVCV
jgi:hypothetical protein